MFVNCTHCYATRMLSDLTFSVNISMITMHIASESAREAGNGKERMGHMKKTLFFVCLFFVFYKYQLMYYKFNIHKIEFIGKH